MKIPLFTLQHRATVIPFLGSGSYGPKWETDETKFRKNVPCLIEDKIKKTTNASGTDIIQKAYGVFPPDVAIKVNDKVIWNEKEYTITELTNVRVIGSKNTHSIEVVLI